ncbi:hypothetical protein [Pseudomonas putida]|uniref:hypothetical protein n=1 Tax=Pseudomonas putida TaxID=303 RepID=UPI00236396AC|nr:hypothetical protein [Pseudomonas putida]MDD2101064.1 hypothetical protein [Pseudomonas putida]
MHYLLWEQPTTLLIWDAASFRHDSTLGYADAPGFRCGGFPEYPGFDSVAHVKLAVRVRPLTAMDFSIIDRHYLGLRVSKVAFLQFNEFKDFCRAEMMILRFFGMIRIFSAVRGVSFTKGFLIVNFDQTLEA